MAETRFRVSVVQARSSLFDTEMALRRAAEWIEAAAVEHGSQLIVLPGGPG